MQVPDGFAGSRYERLHVRAMNAARNAYLRRRQARQTHRQADHAYGQVMLRWRAWFYAARQR